MKNIRTFVLFMALVGGFATQSAQASEGSFAKEVLKSGIMCASSTPGRIVIGAGGFTIFTMGLYASGDHLNACYKGYKKVKEVIVKYTEKHPWIRKSAKLILPPSATIAGVVVMCKMLIGKDDSPIK